MITALQNKLYWREWGAVVRAGKAMVPPNVPDRHELHVAALGRDKSHTTFNNGELDKVLAEFRSRSRPADLGAQVNLVNMAQTRLLHGLNNHPFGPAYVAAIARGKFGTEDLESLTYTQLEQLRNTLAARTAAKRRQQPATAPQEANCPF